MAPMGKAETEAADKRDFVEGRIALVASDIDGTLFDSYDRNTIDTRIFDQISELVGRGIIFLASSGRPYRNLRQIFAPVADQVAYLAENGAVVIVDDKTVIKHAMPREIALSVSHAVMNTPGLDLLISGERTSYALVGEDEFLEHLRTVVGVEPVLLERPEDTPEEILKVSYHAPAERMGEVGDDFMRRFGGVCQVVTSGAIWMDIMGRGVDKGTTMAELGALWGIDPADMLAFGDNDNDLGMLQVVGHPYLMESGNADMRGLIKDVRLCDSVGDTLARLLG